MSADKSKLLVRRYYEEVVNTGDVNRLAEFISPAYVEVHDNTRYPIGLEGAKDHVLGVRETYPDLHLTVEHQIAEGEWVVTRVSGNADRGACLALRCREFGTIWLS